MNATARSVAVKVAGQPVTFTSYESLEVEAAVQRQAIRSIEAGALTQNPRDVDAWRRLEQRAADLLAVLTAMEEWIAADDADLEAAIAAARAAVREI